jgi:ribonuclease R
MDSLPDKDRIRRWIADNPGLSARRDIARAFGIKGAARLELKRLLRDLEDEGMLDRQGRRYRDAGPLPPVSVLRILPADADGDQFAEPLDWQGADDPPRILYLRRPEDPALAEGDRILARLTEVADEGHALEARLIRRIGASPRQVLGIFRKAAEGGRIVPIDRGADREWSVARDAAAGARDGELVEAELAGPRRLGLPQARIIARLGDPAAPRAVSLIAIHQHGIPDQFPDAVLAEAEAAEPAGSVGRTDLTGLAFVTIDPADARDHDDAVFAEADPDPANPGGHLVWVAIADVAHYVRPGTALDREARRRGNSTYFPDRVVPMLPDRLSGDLCSLVEGALRPVIGVKLRLDARGHKIGHHFLRGIIRSAASLDYAEVQAAADGQPNARCAALMDRVIAPLYAAYAAAAEARALREPLDLDLPERRIVLTEDGRVASVAFRERLEAHRLIEEFMILANVAAAEELDRLRQPLLYRVHEEPSPEKLDALREVARASGFLLAKGQVLRTSHLNRLLAQAEGSEFDELLNITTLRSMTQAYYHPQNFGHFGLALRAYAHFTSPIRRYADLIVHRALIVGHRWGEDGLSKADVEVLEETARQISETERRSMAAERETTDRYLAAYLADRVGASFSGRVSGVQRFGLFVRLDETGADGLVPIREVGREFFHFDAGAQTLMGADTGTVIGVGQRVRVRLAEAEPVTGGLLFELIEIEGQGLPAGKAARGGRYRPRKPGPAAARTAKLARKVTRRRT